DYIELIRGTSGDLDIRGSSQIANITLYEEMADSSLQVEIRSDFFEDNTTEPGGSVSYSGKSGDLDYLISAVAEPRYDHRVRNEHSILGDFLPNDEIVEDTIRDQTQYTVSTNLGYQLNEQSSVRLNALYSQNDDTTTVDRSTLDLRDVSGLPYLERELIPGEQSNWEIGGDYEYNFANGNRAKILVIANETDNANIRERFEIDGSGVEIKNLYLNSASTLSERIARGSYTMDFLPSIFEGQSIEFGMESAQTILDSSLRLGQIVDGGIASDSFGGLVPVAIANANTKVEEQRYEGFAIHNWRINSKMSLESALVYETSDIEQSGDVSNSRTFSYFKPKFDYRYDITPKLQLRALVEKVVRQINFTDFVAATDNEDDDSNTQSGNTQLEPDFWWNYNLLVEYRLPEDVGVVSANLYKHHHRNFLQRIDVSPSPDNLQSANGNTGSGDMWVFEVKASVRLSMLNMPNVLVTTLASVRDSEYTDPFLGIDRRFNNYKRGQFDIGFRHDLPQWKMNWGIDLNNQIDGNTKRWDIDDIEDYYADPFLTGFAEIIAFDDITFRLDVKNISDADMCRDRTRYVGHIRDNILEEIEYSCRGSGTVFSLKVSSTF
ncbi:MAG: hypothetical protein COC19_04540, partial [SAR86 cluster bacterium]